MRGALPEAPLIFLVRKIYMAQAIEILAESPLEHVQLLLIYDDVTLIGSAVQVLVDNAVKPCTISVVLSDGTAINQVVQPKQQNQIFNIPVGKRPQGVLKTTQFGLPTIDWGFRSVGISF